ncbi:hypothetical protein FACUT_14076 [Fusarium acutatum]|uniref:Uncharacterized protein n=1 Tax=Fusarium acutatum TaxID=78861 RepID=A0A8H4ND86_9HYPO|nr:hypothetical protein FACUT_14076 [Fusarium acutatum]
MFPFPSMLLSRDTSSMLPSSAYSGISSPGVERKHIGFNYEFEQCIAVEVKDDDDDDGDCDISTDTNSEDRIDGAWDEEGDESRGCDDGDRDEYSDEDEEDYSNDYEGPQAGNRSNKNDKYYDVNNGEDATNADSAFSLPSGLWLHLSEAIFQLSRIFWTYQEPTRDMFASAIIHSTAVLGIHGPSLAFHLAYGSSSRLAALMWIGRLLFLEYAVPIYAYNSLDFAWPCRKAYLSQTDRISFIRCKYLLRGCYTPFGELIELKGFAKSIVKRERVLGNLT